MKTKPNQKADIQMFTLGCSKNLVDSEVFMGQMEQGGVNVEHEAYDSSARIRVINTCGFIDNAKQESIDTILQSIEQKKEGELDKVVVTGCLSERYADDLKQEMPEVDAWFGTQEDIPNLVEYFGVDYKQELIGERKTSTDSHFAYLKISEGCNRTCAFCAIPLMRGKHLSRSIDDLVEEAKFLASKGVKELMLIAQELTYYGLDLYKERKLADLLKALSDIEGIQWIRLHYAYPHKFPMDIIDAMAALPKVCNYLDIPLQHASNTVLERMKRNTSREYTKDLIQAIRAKVPNIAIRTTMLVGFPGETEEEFQELLDFVAELQFERLGVFTYSHEEGTSGFELEDNIPDELKQERAAIVMEAQQDISFQLNTKRIGQQLTVLIDKVDEGVAIARTEFDSPEVDNEVIIELEENQVVMGEFYKVTITDATEFDLHAKLCL